MSFPYDLASVLVGAPDNTLLRVRRIQLEHFRARCADQGVREGDEIIRRGFTSRGIAVELPGGDRKELALGIAPFVEIEVLGEHSASVHLESRGGAETLLL